MASLIGTAGHVDHGKTTLIQALTGIDADRLPEEKRRGMTIDVGFAHLDLPGVGRVSIVDVPGHERFLTNMLVGALGIDLALLCVAADEGVMPQTREHLEILDVLPVQTLIIAMTRADLADPETRELAQADVEETLAPTRFKDAPLLFVSAHTGEGLDALKASLAAALTPNAARPTPGEAWYLPVDRAFSVKGHGLVVTGSLAQGSVRVGDSAVLEPGGVPVRIRGIEIHGETAERSERGTRTALNLSGVRQEDVRRGQAVGAPGSLFETSMLDARVRWVDAPKHGERVRLSIGADEAIGRVFLNDHEPELVQLRLERPVAAALGQPLVIRRYSPPRLLAGGRVSVPQAKVRRKSEDVKAVKARDLRTAIIEAVGDGPEGTPTEEICRRLGKSPQALGDAFEDLRETERLHGFAGLWLSPQGYREGTERFLAALAELHQANPTQTGIPRERVVAAARLPWSGKPLDRIVSDLASKGRVSASGTLVRDVAFRPQLPPRQRQFLDRVIEQLVTEEVNTPTPFQIAQSLGVPISAAEEIMRLGVQVGELVQLADIVFYTPAQLDALKSRLAKIVGDQPFAAGEIRDALGTSRKYAIPLLEYFDATRFTLRVGEKRVIR